jgi:hypothetical protein
MPRRIYIIDPGAEVSADVLSAAASANCPEIMAGVAASLGLDPGTRGAVEIPDPPAPPPAPKSDAEKLAAARDALAVVSTIEAPVLTADVLDVLTDLAVALED